MAVIFTDKEIGDLLYEQKPLPENWPAQVRLRLNEGTKNVT